MIYDINSIINLSERVYLEITSFRTYVRSDGICITFYNDPLMTQVYPSSKWLVYISPNTIEVED
jgi:hypothetical protein